MKTWLRIIAVVAGLVLGTTGSVTAQDTQNFTIRRFQADYYLGRDDQRVSTLIVEEEIVAIFPNFDQNHGILRAIPERYRGHSLDLDIESVTTAGGQKWNYDTYTENDNLVLRIGDADRYLHGEQTFRIKYSMRGVVSHYEHLDEFFWDVNGDQWQQTFEQVTARVHVSAELATHMLRDRRCFTVESAEAKQDCTVDVATEQGGSTVITFETTEPLGPRQTLSILLGFNKGVFAEYQRRPGDVAKLVATVVGLGLLPPLAASIYMLRRWYHYGRDPKGRGVIIPEYLPPKDFNVIDSHVLLKESFAPNAISALILDMAVRGYIKVYELKNKKILKDTITYQLELMKEPRQLDDDSQEVVTMLLGKNAKAGTIVALDTLKNKLYSHAGKLGVAASRRLAEKGYFRVEPSKAKRPYIIGGTVLLILGFFGVPFTLGILVAGLILLLASTTMPARTQKGVEARDYLLGLRDYMQLAEKDRIQALQSPHGKLTQKIDVSNKAQLVKLYERLLPYAMLFGIEKDWAKQFAGLYQQPPEWYSGSSGFHTAAFASSLSDFSSASTASFTAPSSSSSGGFSGGGGSGGGGGGGGGGGW